MAASQRWTRSGTNGNHAETSLQPSAVSGQVTARRMRNTILIYSTVLSAHSDPPIIFPYPSPLKFMPPFCPIVLVLSTHISALFRPLYTDIAPFCSLNNPLLFVP